MPDRGAGGERVRIGAAAAQLEVVAPSAGARELVGQGRPVPDGHRRARHVGASFRRCPACRTTTPTATAAAPLRAVVDVGQAQGDSNFPRGYHIEVGGGYGMPGSARSPASSIARGLRREAEAGDSRRVRRRRSASRGRGEMIPNEESFCEIDPTVKDKWGIPVLRFHWKWSDHELNQVRHMQKTFRAILEGMGGQIARADAAVEDAAPRRPAAQPDSAREDKRRRPARPARRPDRSTLPPGSPRRWVSRRRRPAACRFRAAARSFTRSAPCAWATTRRRAC